MENRNEQIKQLIVQRLKTLREIEYLDNKKKELSGDIKDKKSALNNIDRLLSDITDIVEADE